MLKNKNQSQILVITTCIAIFCNLLWGTPFPVLKILYAQMHIQSSDLGGNITLISLRFILAALFLFLFAIFTKAPLFHLTKKQWLLVATLGLFSTTLQYFFFNIGVNNTSGIKASILGQVGIFFSVILAHFIYEDDKLNVKKIIGLALGFLGLVLINLDKSTEGMLHFKLLGEGFMLFSGLVGSLALFTAKRIGKELPSIVYTTWQMLIGSILLFVVGYLMGGRVTELHFTPFSLILLVYLALLSSVAFCLWYSILQFRKVGEIALYKFIVPVSGTILTALLIPNEHLLPIHIVALLLVALGIISVNRKKG
ncbi:DMT family transporter [Sporanaerobium hydrogeniformans]|uniref:DMT family transporter n=1 Tax=Sporanaerobium hydrogeniformans TaxID=3072179 RepID=UPI001179B055|nr:DMT family transporter [Sporanaerobium hydrogeniformans]